MIPDPLHPAVVHFPIVLMFFLPILALGSLWAIRRHGVRPVTAWSVPVIASALLVASATVSLKTGEAQEERVESRVAEAVVKSHEEAAEQFLVASGGVFVLLVLGLAATRVGSAARSLGTAAALALVVAGYRVGHTGGRIVYGAPGQSGLMTAPAGQTVDDDE